MGEDEHIAILASTKGHTARQLTEQASPLQRRAHTIRLRALRTHHLDLPGLADLITLIDPR
ncbi:hypothetical protein BH18ACT9_BH18ACT9_20720 [soil metagenome]